ncbi:hypothetical protein Tco_0500528 [Tanacetum coccineum]
MIELRADKELKDTIMVAMPKLAVEGFNLCIIHVKYEWKPPRCSSYKVFGHVLNACPKKIVSDVVMNNPRQATRDDNDLGMNEGNSKSAGKGSLNLAHGSSSNTPIIDKIDKLERQIFDGKLMFVDDDYDPYDDDLYESHDMSNHLQAICDDLDITIYGQKKK